MLPLTTAPKVKDFVQNQLITPLNDYFDRLVNGDLVGVEQELKEALQTVHDHVMQELLPLAVQKISRRNPPSKESKAIKRGCVRCKDGQSWITDC